MAASHRIRRASLLKRRAACLAATLLCASWAVGLAAPAQAWDDWTPLYEHYSMDDGCGRLVDPITLVFFGSNLTGENQRRMVEYHTGWLSQNDAATQSTKSYSACDQMDADAATTCGSFEPLSDDDCDRWHVRLNLVGKARWSAIAAGQAVGPSDDVVAGTPHYEIYDENCKDGSVFGYFGAGGHRTTDFAGPRDKVKNDMASYHPWEQVYYGTTDPRPQCIEQTETSVTHDGWAYYIYSWDPGLLPILDQP